MDATVSEMLKTAENTVLCCFGISDTFPVLYCKVLAVLAGLGPVKPDKTV